jgi:hypothetical protein
MKTALMRLANQVVGTRAYAGRRRIADELRALAAELPPERCMTEDEAHQAWCDEQYSAYRKGIVDYDAPVLTDYEQDKEVLRNLCCLIGDYISDAPYEVNVGAINVFALLLGVDFDWQELDALRSAAHDTPMQGVQYPERPDLPF